MVNYKNNIAYLIKTIYRQHPGKIKLQCDGTKKEFSLDYYVSLKVAKELNRNYYFGTEIYTGSFEEYLRTLKELLKVKRALKNIK